MRRCKGGVGWPGWCDDDLARECDLAGAKDAARDGAAEFLDNAR
jgi:hypothetical protein